VASTDLREHFGQLQAFGRVQNSVTTRSAAARMHGSGGRGAVVVAWRRAAAVVWAVKTVDKHRENLVRKLEVNSVVQLIHKARELGVAD
jgi:hypothetical protein